ncbi:MAG: hypothetical protein KDB21_20030 [Acidimicrobiales bacterium]|nr:hypothetical protein [Acidimicrobiales bacterium]
MKRLRRLVAAVVQILVVIPLGAVAARAESVGVYPAVLEFGAVGRDGFGIQVLVIENGADRPQTFTLGADGDAGTWLSFHTDRQGALAGSAPITSVDVPAGSQVEVFARLAVPDEIANGDYAGTVAVRQADAGTSGVTLAAQVAVAVAVDGDQRLAGELVGVEVDETEEGLPLGVRLRIANSGNVVLVPEVLLRVTADGQVLDSVLLADQAVAVGEEALIAEVVQLEGVIAGDYTLEVSATYAGTDLGSLEVPLQIASRGTYTRDGALTELTLRGEPRLGALVEVVGTFENTGAISTLAVLEADVYRGDVLVGNLTSPPLRVGPGEQRELSVFVPVKDRGEHRIEAHVSFDGESTPTDEIDFGTGGGGSNNTPLVVAAGAGVGLAALGGGLAARTSRRRERVHVG